MRHFKIPTTASVVLESDETMSFMKPEEKLNQICFVFWKVLSIGSPVNLVKLVFL